MKSFLRIVTGATAIFILFIGSRSDAQAQMGSRQVASIGASYAVTLSGNPVSIHTETITGRMAALNSFAWKYGYDINVTDGALIVRVAINLIPARGIAKSELDRVKQLWEEGIERVWSHKFALETAAGRRYPIVVDVSFRGPHFHHEVIVRPGAGRSDQLNWNIKDRPAIAAHEFGHMVGVFDEYEKGATAPQSEIIDATSIMTSNPTAGITHARHYQGFRAWFAETTRLSDVTLLPIDNGKREPDAFQQQKRKDYE